MLKIFTTEMNEYLKNKKDTCNFIFYGRRKHRKRPIISRPVFVDPDNLEGDKWRYVILTTVTPKGKDIVKPNGTPIPPIRKKRKQPQDRPPIKACQVLPNPSNEDFTYLDNNNTIQDIDELLISNSNFTNPVFPFEDSGNNGLVSESNQPILDKTERNKDDLLFRRNYKILKPKRKTDKCQKFSCNIKNECTAGDFCADPSLNGVFERGSFCHISIIRGFCCGNKRKVAKRNRRGKDFPGFNKFKKQMMESTYVLSSAVTLGNTSLTNELLGVFFSSIPGEILLQFRRFCQWEDGVSNSSAATEGLMMSSPHQTIISSLKNYLRRKSFADYCNYGSRVFAIPSLEPLARTTCAPLTFALGLNPSNESKDANTKTINNEIAGTECTTDYGCSDSRTGFNDDNKNNSFSRSGKRFVVRRKSTRKRKVVKQQQTSSENCGINKFSGDRQVKESCSDGRPKRKNLVKASKILLKKMVVVSKVTRVIGFCKNGLETNPHLKTHFVKINN